jgi:hypothetical protein
MPTGKAIIWRADRAPGGAGPVGSLLGGKDPTGRLFELHCFPAV